MKLIIAVSSFAFLFCYSHNLSAQANEGQTNSEKVLECQINEYDMWGDIISGSSSKSFQVKLNEFEFFQPQVVNMRNSYLVRVDANSHKAYSKAHNRKIDVFTDQEKLIVQTLPRYSQKDRESENIKLFKLSEIDPVDSYDRLIADSKITGICGTPGMGDERKFAGVEICCSIPGRK